MTYYHSGIFGSSGTYVSTLEGFHCILRVMGNEEASNNKRKGIIEVRELYFSNNIRMYIFIYI